MNINPVLSIGYWYGLICKRSLRNEKYVLVHNDKRYAETYEFLHI